MTNQIDPVAEAKRLISEEKDDQTKTEIDKNDKKLEAIFVILIKSLCALEIFIASFRSFYGIALLPIGSVILLNIVSIAVAVCILKRKPWARPVILGIIILHSLKSFFSGNSLNSIGFMVEALFALPILYSKSSNQFFLNKSPISNKKTSLFVLRLAIIAFFFFGFFYQFKTIGYGADTMLTEIYQNILHIPGQLSKRIDFYFNQYMIIAIILLGSTFIKASSLKKNWKKVLTALVVGVSGIALISTSTYLLKRPLTLKPGKILTIYFHADVSPEIAANINYIDLESNIHAEKSTSLTCRLYHKNCLIAADIIKYKGFASPQLYAFDNPYAIAVTDSSIPKIDFSDLRAGNFKNCRIEIAADKKVRMHPDKIFIYIGRTERVSENSFTSAPILCKIDRYYVEARKLVRKH